MEIDPGIHILEDPNNSSDIMKPILFFALLLFGGCTSESQTIDYLKSNVESHLSEAEGIFGIWFQSIDNPGLHFSINPDSLFHAASTMKTPVMIEIFKQANAGKFSMNDSILIKNEFTSIADSSAFELTLNPDGDDPYEAKVGEKASINDLTHAMITYSSNLSTNLMIELVGAESTTQTMRDLGARNIEVLRGVEDLKAFDLGLSNRTTPRDLGIILEAIAKGEAVNSKADSTMVEILKDQFYRDVIPLYLPDDVVTATKSGFITGVRHDSGIIYLPDGRSYVLVYLSKNLSSGEAGQIAGAGVSRMVYDFLIRES